MKPGIGILCAAIVTAFGSAVPAQQPTNCSPVQSPQGPVTQQMATCAINHAQYLYWLQCGQKTVCNESSNVKAAYELAVNTFDQSLYSLPQPANYSASRTEQIHNQFRRGFLSERAHDFELAYENYKACADAARETRDNNYLGYCLTGLNRLMCAENPNGTTCRNSQPTEQAVLYTTTSSGGGRTASALDADDDSGDRQSDPTVSIAARITSPSTAETAELRNSMTPEEREELARAIEVQRQTTLKPQ